LPGCNLGISGNGNGRQLGGSTRLDNQIVGAMSVLLSRQMYTDQRMMTTTCRLVIVMVMNLPTNLLDARLT
jgi:hypothetical protein